MKIQDIEVGDTLCFMDYHWDAPRPKRDIGTIYENDAQWMRCVVIKKFRGRVTVVTQYGREFTDRASEFLHKIEVKK